MSKLIDCNLIKLKSKINISNLIDYYTLLENKYVDYKWFATESGGKELYGENSKFQEMYGYALQSRSTQNIKNKPAYHTIPKEYESNVSTNTDLFFGIIEELNKHFPKFYDHAILVHPPGAFAQQHTDTNLKIHIPIITNPRSYFVFSEEKYNLQADGSMYFTNTYNSHGVINEGDSARVHLIVKINEEDLEEYLNKEVYIKV